MHRDSSVQMSVKSIHSSIYRISNGIIENLALLEFLCVWNMQMQPPLPSSDDNDDCSYNQAYNDYDVKKIVDANDVVDWLQPLL